MVNITRKRLSTRSGYGFYDPPSTEYPIRLKGLHGGTQWPGFSSKGDLVLVAISNEKTFLRLKEISPRNQKSASFDECRQCHNGVQQSRISAFVGTRSRDEFAQLITEGWQAMPSVSVTKQRLDEILSYLIDDNAKNNFDSNIPPSYVKEPYKKDVKKSDASAEVVLLDIQKGREIWRKKIDALHVGLTIPSTALLNDNYGLVSGGLGQQVAILDLSTSEVALEVEFENIECYTACI